jgi:hypothetical protein
MKRALWVGCLVLLLAFAVSGCGRFQRPGFKGQQADTGTVETPKTKLPAKPIVEWGSPDAKVRIIAFFFISDDFKTTMDLLQGLVKQYPGKVYVKYADLRTQEGNDLRARTGSSAGGAGLLIDGKSEVTIQAKPRPYTVAFDQDMGRFWTPEDLKAAVAQAVAKAYGK